MTIIRKMLTSDDKIANQLLLLTGWFESLHEHCYSVREILVECHIAKGPLLAGHVKLCRPESREVYFCEMRGRNRGASHSWDSRYC